MRGGLTISLLLAIAPLTHAQEQEQKLLDRLLRPDMSLQNDAQAKQFHAPGATTTKTVKTKSFLFFERKPDKAFWDTRQVTPKSYETEQSPHAAAKAGLRTRSQLKTNVAYATSAYGDVRTSRETGKTVAVSDSPDNNRTFLGEGKSQKSLSKQDRPMTIDEVRELLNKNK